MAFVTALSVTIQANDSFDAIEYRMPSIGCCASSSACRPCLLRISWPSQPFFDVRLPPPDTAFGDANLLRKATFADFPVERGTAETRAVEHLGQPQNTIRSIISHELFSLFQRGTNLPDACSGNRGSARAEP